MMMWIVANEADIEDDKDNRDYNDNEANKDYD